MCSTNLKINSAPPRPQPFPLLYKPGPKHVSPAGLATTTVSTRSQNAYASHSYHLLAALLAAGALNGPRARDLDALPPVLRVLALVDPVGVVGIHVRIF